MEFFKGFFKGFLWEFRGIFSRDFLRNFMDIFSRDFFQDFARKGKNEDIEKKCENCRKNQTLNFCAKKFHRSNCCRYCLNSAT